jgi:hypothetical protein
MIKSHNIKTGRTKNSKPETFEARKPTSFRHHLIRCDVGRIGNPSAPLARMQPMCILSESYNHARHFQELGSGSLEIVLSTRSRASVMTTSAGRLTSIDRTSTSSLVGRSRMSNWLCTMFAPM